LFFDIAPFDWGFAFGIDSFAGAGVFATVSAGVYARVNARLAWSDGGGVLTTRIFGDCDRHNRRRICRELEIQSLVNSAHPIRTINEDPNIRLFAIHHILFFHKIWCRNWGDLFIEFALQFYWKGGPGAGVLFPGLLKPEV